MWIASWKVEIRTCGDLDVGAVPELFRVLIAFSAQPRVSSNPVRLAWGAFARPGRGVELFVARVVA